MIVVPKQINRNQVNRSNSVMNENHEQLTPNQILGLSKKPKDDDILLQNVSSKQVPLLQTETSPKVIDSGYIPCLFIQKRIKEKEDFKKIHPMTPTILSPSKRTF
jgi:hypothetical protein